ncbi:dTDP-4-dehydrorhamnose reductase [Blastopirellula sp. JC732]|uniref:dTDP-4-dehydrorhamnose reductase n=1 Tax=Blastopirellula sediminis TaxID=2894196 RepID=A0A9X1ML01_9BACT|nr:dTDP-4-dehydrorhamnose reductase [Blastopirellula sediminis]MCC9608447.1 dTDP-4-dehydrorhamnose reductase [Blastopirellula sediminis]MCC9628776.1 dTDP-4-dehydrorhamnose reductase [Blastopirellula sediminis]
MNSTIAITGAAGQLGGELAKQLGGAAASLTRSQFDLSDDDSIRRVLAELRPSVLINCAAYTAVDMAETDADACFRANAKAVATMAELCHDLNIRFVQISTDYVFDAYAGIPTPLSEETPTSPQGIYAQSKLQGELAAATAPNHLIVRTCGLYGGGPTKRNFVETMIRLSESKPELRVVNDQRCTPSYCRDVATAVLRLIRQDATGLYHVTNSESVTWYDMAQEVFSLTRRSTHVHPITTTEYGAPAPRPAYSVLSLNKYAQATGQEMPTWRDALQRYLADRRFA